MLEIAAREQIEARAAVLRQRRQEQADAAERVRQLLEGLLTGYRMGLQRVDRALDQHGLDPIPTAGEPFDPEFMEVVEAVADSGQLPGEVIEEVRRGYLWRGLDLGPACNQCGGMMQRTGSCYTCSSCGNNTGCG